MRLSILSLLPLLATAAACGGSGSGNASSLDSTPASSASLTATKSNNIDILAKIYDTNYLVPEGFFIDERVETNTRSYTVHHVLDPTGSFELCSDDLVIAQAWEQSDNDSRAVNGYYVSSYENERYFEFVRELEYDQGVGNIVDPTSPSYARIFKCAHTNRDGVNRALLDGYSGTLGPGAIDDIVLRDFTEYLWQFRFFNVSRKIVIASVSHSTSIHTLLLAFLINQGAIQCDRIDVIEWQFIADRQTGSVTREFNVIRSFEATQKNGIPQICE